MVAQITPNAGTVSSSGSRIFRYEVVGLRQNSETDKNKYSIRNSGSVFITVPYSRLNEEYQRITRLGGKIIKIEQLSPKEAE